MLLSFSRTGHQIGRTILRRLQNPKYIAANVSADFAQSTGMDFVEEGKGFIGERINARGEKVFIN